MNIRVYKTDEVVKQVCDMDQRWADYRDSDGRDGHPDWDLENSEMGEFKFGVYRNEELAFVSNDKQALETMREKAIASQLLYPAGARRVRLVVSELNEQGQDPQEMER